MNKNYLFLLIFISIIFIYPFVTHAEIKNLDLPGYTCGIAEDIGKNRCCKQNVGTSIIRGILIPDLGTPILDLPKNLILGVGFGIVDALIKPFYEYETGIIVPCHTGEPRPNSSAPNCTCINTITPTPGALIALDEFCKSQKSKKDQDGCKECAGSGGVYSGIGCIQTDSKKFIEETVFGLGIGIAGMVSLLCIIYASFMMQSSQGSPEKIKKASELLTSCIMGLMLIIFSVFILRLIGVSILRIPGFS